MKKLNRLHQQDLSVQEAIDIIVDKINEIITELNVNEALERADKRD